MDKKIKVAWICDFSNEKVRKHLPRKTGAFKKILYRIKGKNVGKFTDYAIWDTNAIEEFEKINDVDLHVICPVRGLAKPIVKYTEDGIHYCFFREQNSSTLKLIFHQLFTKYSSQYRKNRKYIRGFIKEINPDIVHVMGAENPNYSMSLLDIPANIPTIIQLQALLTRLVDVTNDEKQKKEFYYKGLIERAIINKADYIGTAAKEFRQFIIEKIKPNACFLDLRLAMAQKINLAPCEKIFDFVYFASNINKSGSDAIESFILACKQNPKLTLDIVGGYDKPYKEELDIRIKENGLEHNIKFEGRLPSHDDVISQIRKARFALIPLKMDLVPNTIHEAMANGLPVVTTITDGTPRLNAKRQSILLSPQGNYQAMSDNMLALVNDERLANELRKNAVKTEEERSSNRAIITEWCEAYMKYGRQKMA